MAFSIRGLTRGVMGGITAYRRGALQGQEQNRELATAEQARARQAKQDELAAMYKQIEFSLDRRRLAATETNNAEDVRIRELAAENRPPTPYRALTREQMLADEEERARIGARYRPPTPRVSTNPRIAELDRAIDDARGAIATARGGLSAPSTRRGRPITPSDTAATVEIQRQMARLQRLTAERDELTGGAAPVSPYGPRP